MRGSVHSKPPRWRRALLIALAAVWCASADDDCLGGVDEPVPCRANCDIEAECGFRTLAACQAASCDPLTGAPLFGGPDTCLANAGDCLEAAACACDAGCDKLDTCADGGENASCADDCDTLVEQLPKETYLEQRCRLESSCEDIAVCGSVGG